MKKMISILLASTAMLAATSCMTPMDAEKAAENEVVAGQLKVGDCVLSSGCFRTIKDTEDQIIKVSLDGSKNIKNNVHVTLNLKTHDLQGNITLSPNSCDINSNSSCQVKLSSNNAKSAKMEVGQITAEAEGYDTRIIVVNLQPSM